MGSVHPIFRRLGCIQDPLLQVVERIQAVLGERPGTVSADPRGNLFISVFDGQTLDPRAGQEIIGIYNLATPLSAIEGDLRRLLRQRARAWIVDWDVPCRAATARDSQMRGKQRKRINRKRSLSPSSRDTTGATP